MATTSVSCGSCKSKIKLVEEQQLPQEDDYDPMKVTCPKCNQVFYIASVEVVLCDE